MAEIDAYWALAWGCDVRLLTSPGVVVLPAELPEPPGAMHRMRRPPATLVGAASELLPALRSAVAQLDPTTPVTIRRLLNAVGWDSGAFVLHRGYRMYLAPGEFMPIPNTARPVTNSERAEVQSLLDACDPDEVRESEISADLPVLFGIREHGRLCAVSGVNIYDDLIADVRVLVRPEHRRLGLARQSVSAVCAWCLANDRIVQYECADWNLASLALARTLGFRIYAKVEVALPLVAAAS